MKKILVSILSIIMLTMCFGTTAKAAVMSYEDEYLELDVPESTLIMTKDTSQIDEVWAKAGVTNVSDKLEDFDDMGVVAAFYDPETKVTVNFMSKQSAETLEAFDFISMTEAEFTTYINELAEATTDTVKVEIEKYEHTQSPFFRMKISVDTVGSEARELLYGTLINGEMISFDIYHEGREEIDETFIKQLVDSVHFTRIITEEEYSDMVRESTTRLIIFIAAIVLIIVALIFFFRYRRKAAQKRSKQISAYMQEFREKKSQGQLGNTVLYLNDTIYNEEIIATFCLFHMWIKDIIKYVCMGIALVAAILWMYSMDSLIYCLLAAGLVVVYVYQRTVGIEKMKKIYDKRYETKSKRRAVMRFYDEYFTISGLGSISEYTYKQITDARLYKEYIFLYTGTEQAVFIDKNGFSQGTGEEFMRFINEKKFK